MRCPGCSHPIEGWPCKEPNGNVWSVLCFHCNRKYPVHRAEKPKPARKATAQARAGLFHRLGGALRALAAPGGKS